MQKFLVESSHTPHTCRMAVKDVMAMGYLNNFEWGCLDGVHTGWAMIEAEDEKQALGVVPAMVRDKARAVRLSRFAPNIVQQWED